MAARHLTTAHHSSTPHLPSRQSTRRPDQSTRQRHIPHHRSRSRGRQTALTPQPHPPHHRTRHSLPHRHRSPPRHGTPQSVWPLTSRIRSHSPEDADSQGHPTLLAPLRSGLQKRLRHHRTNRHSTPPLPPLLRHPHTPRPSRPPLLPIPLRHPWHHHPPGRRPIHIIRTNRRHRPGRWHGKLPLWFHVHRIPRPPPPPPIPHLHPSNPLGRHHPRSPHP